MTEDRKAVEQAIEWARARYGQMTVPERFHFSILADAAEKWLATQPEPLWKVRVWQGETGPGGLTEWKTEQRALLHASSAFTAGARKVEIEKP